MTIEPLVATAAPALITGIIGYISGALTSRIKERRALRVEAVDAIAPRLEHVRRLVRYSPVEGDSAEWLKASSGALEGVESHAHRLPARWRHLHHSVRSAIGEASGGMGFADRYPPGTNLPLAPYCATWAGHAEDYLSYTLRALRVWRDDLGLVGRREPELLRFDRWLHVTERHPGPCTCRADG